MGVLTRVESRPVYRQLTGDDPLGRGAAAEPEGDPWSGRKALVWWDERQRRRTGHDDPDFFAPDRERDRYHPWAEPNSDVCPYVVTTYRLTEHLTAGVRPGRRPRGPQLLPPLAEYRERGGLRAARAVEVRG